MIPLSMHNLFFTFKKSVCAALLGGAVLLSAPLLSLPVQAETLTDDGHPYDEAAEAERLAEPVQSNTLQNWPQGPSCSAEGAIVMDMDTGAILYQKNIHEKLYPASTTKMLTCLIAAENLDLSDTVTFSEEAVNSVPADGSSIGISALRQQHQRRKHCKQFFQHIIVIPFHRFQFQKSCPFEQTRKSSIM